MTRVNKYNNTYFSTIKMRPIDIQSNQYILFGIKNNDKDTNFKVGRHVRTSIYKNNFAKGYTQSEWNRFCDLKS